MDTRIIFLGDLVGRAGRKVVKDHLGELLRESSLPTVVIANAENAAAGFGLTKKVYNELCSMGIHICTSGNHIWDKADVSNDRQSFAMLATPVNMKNKPYVVHHDVNGLPLTVISLVGKVFMPQDARDPFTTFDEIYEAENCAGRAVLIDFHAEATSEKAAFAAYAKGRATAIIGTHTHVQTADERILPDGTFFISDVGACCAVNSVLGMTVESSLSRFVATAPQRMAVELDDPLMINAVELVLDSVSAKVSSYRRLQRIY